MVTGYQQLLAVLVDNEIRFIVVGGMAAVVHGAARLTFDLDVVYDRDPENMERIVRTLEPYRPYLRGAPPELPFSFDLPTLKAGLNFTLVTSIGNLDLLGEITGGGGYDELKPFSEEIDVQGIRCWCLGLERLIHVKRAAGRPRDLEAVAELELLARERKKGP